MCVSLHIYSTYMHAIPIFKLENNFQGGFLYSVMYSQIRKRLDSTDVLYVIHFVLVCIKEMCLFC